MRNLKKIRKRKVWKKNIKSTERMGWKSNSYVRALVQNCSLKEELKGKKHGIN